MEAEGSQNRPRAQCSGERLPLLLALARLVPRQAVSSELPHSVYNGGFSGCVMQQVTPFFPPVAFDSILREEENPPPWVGPERVSSLRLHPSGTGRWMTCSWEQKGGPHLSTLGELKQ